MKFLDNLNVVYYIYLEDIVNMLENFFKLRLNEQNIHFSAGTQFNILLDGT